jgi:peptide-methionine (S)-S-oxide reductase
MKNLTWLFSLFVLAALAAEAAPTQPKRKPMSNDNKTEIATVGGGCFWCVEAVFERVHGVRTAVSGYSGGPKPNPTYRQICTGTTGHAEVVKITFEPDVISYEDILRVFLDTHDPTTLNRQGNDKGTQYRSVIFTHSDAQMASAKKIVKEMQPKFKDPIVTELKEAPTFWIAEEKHQDYYKRNPRQGYCVYVVSGKVKKLESTHKDKMKAEYQK